MIDIHYVCDYCHTEEVLTVTESAINIERKPHTVEYKVEYSKPYPVPTRLNLTSSESCRVVNVLPFTKIRLCKVCSEKFDNYIQRCSNDKSKSTIGDLWLAFYNEVDRL